MVAVKIDIVAQPNVETAIHVIVRAFSADPAARWLFPDARQYEAAFPAFVQAFAGAAFAHGTAYGVEDCAAALWLPPHAHPDEPALMALLQRIVPADDRAQVFALFEQMDRYHPAEPHWYLPMLGVEPKKQGQGYGSALLEFALARCDREGMPAYLEASSRRSIPLYERHGFELLGTIQVGSSPPLFPMLRRARQRTIGKRMDHLGKASIGPDIDVV